MRTYYLPIIVCIFHIFKVSLEQHIVKKNLQLNFRPYLDIKVENVINF